MAEDAGSKLFKDRKPMLTGRDVVEAARRGRIVVAFDAQPVITAPPRVDALAVKLALAGGETSTILIDRHTATLLRRSSRVSTRCPGRAP
ncbi:MAG TPA: hypothetical protein VF930_10790 [Stellaceae bacterium]